MREREEEKKQQRIYDLLDAKTKPKRISKIIGVSLSTIYKAKKIFLQKSFLRVGEEWKIEQKMKRRLFNCSHYGN